MGSSGQPTKAGHRFSRRTAWETDETEWARLLRSLRAQASPGMDSGVDPRVDPVWDLTASNPTRCGFEYDAEAVLRALRQPSALDYDPNPKGILSAREAVARYYAEHLSASEQVAASERASAGADSQTLDPEHIFLTTSTSEAYSFLFRLLCDPGDEVLIAQPSYPLFDFLADLDDVRLVAYPLFYDYGWHLDPAALRERITPRTRAIALVHPNNPTGHFTKAAERAALEEICAERGLALIVDEVFLDYPLEGSMQPSFNAGEHPALTFVLSGLSKVAALPQMKAAWIACFGPEPALGEALARLEVIADTFLSMNAPVQAALPDWLAGSAELQGQIRGRTKRNLRILDEAFPTGGPVTRLIAEAGWYAVLRIPALATDEETALALLRERKVAVHSGDFFGLGPSGWLVVSLLPEEAMFSNGIKQIANYLQDAIEPGVAI